MDKLIRTYTKVEESERKFYTVGEVAEILRFSSATVYKLIESEKIKAMRFGNGRFRIPCSQVQKIIR